jgi:uncharacterized protein
MSERSRQILAKLFRWLRPPAILYLLILLALMIFEESLIFFPARYPKGNWAPRGIDFEDAWIDATDGVSIHGWYVEHPQPRAVILVAHGNAGNITSRNDLLRELYQLGASVLIFDYRGYGRSVGTPNEAGILADARGARSWLARRAGIPESQIVLFGASLGGGVQVDLAAEDGARGLILVKTFSSLPDVAALHYPFVPVRLLMRTRLDSESKIGRYRGPLLEMHGDRDTVVPFALGQRLFAAANEPKQFLVLEGGDHDDPLTARAFEAIGTFLGGL